MGFNSRDAKGKIDFHAIALPNVPRGVFLINHSDEDNLNIFFNGCMIKKLLIDNEYLLLKQPPNGSPT